MSKGKKVIMWIVIAFAIYFVFKRPEKAADIVAGAWGFLAQGFDSVATFFDALTRRLPA